jgi:hypothetical protein
MGNRKADAVIRAVQPHLGQPDGVEDVILTEDGGLPGRFRRAVIYPVASTVGTGAMTWRLRLEKFPEHNNAGAHGWYGGRVVWNADSANRDEVEAQGREFVEFGWHQ